MLLEILNAMIVYGLIGAAIGAVVWKVKVASRNRHLRQDQLAKRQ